MNHLLSSLTGKPVRSSRGRDVGTLRRLTMNPKTGQLEELIIDPGENRLSDSNLPRTKDGFFKCPFSKIDGVDSVIVVDI